MAVSAALPALTLAQTSRGAEGAAQGHPPPEPLALHPQQAPAHPANCSSVSSLVQPS